MTEKELHKLKRQDFLQLLLTQGHDLEEMQARLDEANAELEQIQQTDERLKEKLNEKDELIEKLKSRLDQKDAAIRALRTRMVQERENKRIEVEEAGSIAKAALQLNGIFEAAQRAADQYLENVKQRYEEGVPLKKDASEFVEKPVAAPVPASVPEEKPAEAPAPAPVPEEKPAEPPAPASAPVPAPAPVTPAPAPVRPVSAPVFRPAPAPVRSPAFSAADQVKEEPFQITERVKFGKKKSKKSRK